MGRGDVDRAVALLASDAVLISDGGPTRTPPLRSELVEVNGRPGLISWLNGKLLWALSVDVRDAAVTSIHVVRNPAKLAALQVATPIL